MTEQIAVVSHASVVALIERLKAMEEALKPFAAAADIYDFSASMRPRQDADLVYEWEDHRVGIRRITVGDFRKARAALEEAK